MRFQLLLLAAVAAMEPGWAACVAPSCTKIIDNGPDGGKRIVAVMGDGYASGDQTKWRNDVNNLIVNGLYGNDFFKENHNAFNVYRIDLVSAQSGVTRRVYDADGKTWKDTPKNTALKYIYNGRWDKLWIEWAADTQALVDAALNRYVPQRNIVVVILNEDGGGGRAGSGGTVMTRSSSWQVVSHEAGHAIGDLIDEYGGGEKWDPDWGPVNGPNCATSVDRTNLFWRRFVSPSISLPTVLSAGMNTNFTVGMFEGCWWQNKGIYRPVANCRMNTNNPMFCPVCYTFMKKALFPYLGHNFGNAYAADVDSGSVQDVLIHNNQDLAILRADKKQLYKAWNANNVVPAAAAGGKTWSPARNDVYFPADFTADNKWDFYAFNGKDWVIPYLTMLRSDGSGLKAVARYDQTIPGIWTMKPSDQFYTGDFDGDRRADVVVFNGADWDKPYLALLRSTGTALSGVVRYDGVASIPGWPLGRADQFFVGDLDGDGKADLYVFNPATRNVGMLKSSGSGLTAVKVFYGALPNWSVTAGDKLLVADFNGDNKSDLYVFNGSNWSFAYLLMARSTGTDLAFVQRYDSSSDAANIPGWQMRHGDRFFLADANKDGKGDLFVYNPGVNWSTEYLGTLLSTGTALSGRFTADWVGGWNLGAGDKLIAANYEGGVGKADIYIRNNDWFGLLRRTPAGFAMDRIYQSWIYSPLYDATPWSNTLP